MRSDRSDSAGGNSQFHFLSRLRTRPIRGSPSLHGLGAVVDQLVDEGVSISRYTL